MDEDLAYRGIAELGNHATPLAQSGKRARRLQGLREDLAGSRRRIGEEVRDDLFEGSLALPSPSLPGAEKPPSPQLFVDFLVGDGPACLNVCDTLGYSVKDVQVVEHVIEGAIIGQLVEQLADRLLGFHG